MTKDTTSKSTSIRIPPRLKERALEQVDRQDHSSLSAYILIALREKVERDEVRRDGLHSNPIYNNPTNDPRV